MQDSLRDLMEAAGAGRTMFWIRGKNFLESDLRTRAACLIVDIRMPKMSGLQLQGEVERRGMPLFRSSSSRLMEMPGCGFKR